MGLDDANKLLKKYQSLRFQWEAEASRKISSTSLEDLKAASQNPDPNIRILASELMGALGDSRAIDALVCLLGDDIQNTYTNIMQSDDDEVICVGATAAEVLVRLGYASDIESAYKRAKDENALPRDCPILYNKR